MTEERRLQLREALQKLEDKHGRITPELVVKEARRNPRSPLHTAFEWDTAKAAKAYWLETARALIRSVYVTVQIEDKTVNVTAYVRDPEADHHDQGYRSILKIREEQEPSRLLLLQEFSQAE